MVSAKPVSPMKNAIETWKQMDAAAAHGRSAGTSTPSGKYTRNATVP